MLEEGVKESGHLQICKNILINLDDLHQQLLGSAKFPFYKEMYYRVLPFVVELRKKGVNTNESELQVCFNALYGYMMLRLKKQEISEDTQTAIKHLSTLLGQLSDYYLKNQKEPIDF
jgi:flagellin-specific chaperone FliS